MKKLAILLILCNMSLCAFPRTIYVDANGTGDYPTIQAAIDDANNGDEIFVLPGIYTGIGNRDIDFGGKAINVCSVSGPELTIIDCQNAGRGFYFQTNEGRDSILCGFMIINGKTDEMRYGAGIGSRGISSPTIKKCIITRCNARNGGGGIASSGARIENCLIFDNYAGWAGGGIWTDHSSIEIINCTIVDNGSGDNYANGLCHWQDGHTTVLNSIVWNEGTSEISGTLSTISVTYSDIKGGFQGNGNISLIPLLGEDYSLLQDSPCIDAGKDAGVYTDILGRARPHDFPNVDNNGSLPEFDMGCYEFTLNIQPVADAGPNQTVYVCLDEIADVNLDGSGSYDDNNDVLDYYWSWIIDGNVFEANGVSPTIQLPAGEHEIELIVDDGTDYSEPDYCTITVIEPLHAKLYCKPHFINTQSRRRTITAMFYMPDGITPEDIDANEPLIFIPGHVESTRQFVFQWQKHGQPCTWVIAAFDKDECVEYLSPGMNRIKVVGRLNNSRCYYGNSGIYIFTPKPFRRNWRFHK